MEERRLPVEAVSVDGCPRIHVGAPAYEDARRLEVPVFRRDVEERGSIQRSEGGHHRGPMRDHRGVRVDGVLERIWIVEQHGRHDRIVEHRAALEHQSHARGERARPHVHFGEPAHRGLSPDRLARVQAEVEERPDLIDRMGLERPDQLFAQRGSILRVRHRLRL